MENLIKLNCYIQEYKNNEGQLCAKLKDKKTNKKVSIVGENADKEHFLRFLSQAKLNKEIMPTIYDREGIDIIAIRGIIESKSDSEIIINIDVEDGGYVFE